VILIRSFHSKSGPRSGGFFCFFVLTTLSIVLCSSHAAEIEDVIPAYSVGYAVIRDVPGIWDSMKSSSSWQSLLSSDELNGEMRDIEAAMNLAGELLGVDLRSLVGLFGQRVAFALIHIDIMNTSLPVVIADVDGSEGAPEMIRKIQQALSQSEEYEIQPEAGTYQNIPYGLLKRREEEFSVRYVFLENLFVLAPGQESFEAVVDVYLGKDPPLVYDPKFNKVKSRVSMDSQIFFYVNLEHPWAVVLSMWGSEWGEALRTLGVQQIKSIAWTVNLLDATRDQELYIYTGNNSSLLTALLAEPKPLISTHLIPAEDAYMFLAANVGDPASAWESILDAVRSITSEEGYAQIQSGIYEFEQETGLNLKDDILSSLTGEIGFATSAPEAVNDIDNLESLMKNGLMIFCGVKDRERLRMSIERTLSAADARVEQMVYKGVTTYLFSHILAPSDQEIPIGYMFAGDLLIFGNFQKFESIINENPPLVVSDKFAQINSRIPKESGLLCYLDLEKVWGLMARSEADMRRLQTLGATGGIMVYDGEGLKAKSVGALGKDWLETIGNLAYLLIHAPF